MLYQSGHSTNIQDILICETVSVVLVQSALSLSVYTWCQISLFLSLSLCLPLSPPQSQGSPYSMSGQRNVRALWANCKGEGRQNQVCVSQPVWYIQRKEPWSTKACWWVSKCCHCHNILYIQCNGLAFLVFLPGVLVFKFCQMVLFFQWGYTAWFVIDQI